MIGGDALQAADGDGFGFDTAATARGLAGPVADTAENAGEDVRFTVDEIGFRELTLCDEPDVLGDVGMRRASPLTIDDAMKIVRISCIGRFHRYLAPYSTNVAPFTRWRDMCVSPIRVRRLYLRG
jgi:hypothetical protein